MTNAYQMTFERHEKKFRLDSFQLKQVQRYLQLTMQPAEHANEMVVSVYYDTPEHVLIERSLEKPIYKEKLRIRQYGQRCDSGLSFVEIKKKFKGISYKRRVPMDMRAAREFLAGITYEHATARHPLVDAAVSGGLSRETERQIVAEIMETRRRLGIIQPMMEISVWRCAFVDPQSDLRVTIDQEACWRIPQHADLPMSDGSPAPRPVAREGMLLEPGEALMEVKSSGAIPLPLARLLSFHDVHTSSFSKYGTAYRMAYASPDVTCRFPVTSPSGAARRTAPDSTNPSRIGPRLVPQV
jgi:hypothetical protein